jgi:6-pyruvoyl-tetrahydropterin synthase
MNRLFVDRLTVIDCALLHPQRGLLGESWLCDLELGGDLDAQGMVLDFADVKRTVKGLIDAAFDHKLLAPSLHPGLEIERQGDRDRLIYAYDNGRRVVHTGPADAVRLVKADTVTPETVAAAIERALRPELPANVSDVRVALRAEPTPGAHYRYSHGLRQHAGNCQRIAHGHRSRIEILGDGIRAPDLEREWAARWHDVYIGARADLVGTVTRDGVAALVFRYAAAQGVFELEIPAESCYLIEEDTTVEHLAAHVANRLAAEHPGHRYRVRAFEGVDKGAIAEA